jgi:hypothetical protein
MEHGLQHQSALNRGVRVDSGCAGSAAQFRVSPPRDGGFIEPESQSASRDESSIVIAPISNTIPEYMVVFLSWAYRTGPVIFWKSATMPLLFEKPATKKPRRRYPSAPGFEEDPPPSANSSRMPPTAPRIPLASNGKNILVAWPPDIFSSDSRYFRAMR